MKVESISIQNFKRFDNLEVSFKNKTLNEVSDRFLILGDNGSGKTTLLQAIALPLALATGQIQSVFNFDWIGFLPGRYSRWGSAPRIELEVSFEDEELEATREVAQKWYDAQPEEFQNDFIVPGKSPVVRVILNGENWKAGETQAERLQFRGRSYAQWLVRNSDFSARSYFAKLPGIFWFDQFRNLGFNYNQDGTVDGTKEHNSGISYERGVGSLRKYLIEWRRKQEGGKNYQNDYLEQLEKYYKKVFPDRSFWGLENRPSLDSPTEETTYFLIKDDGNRRYDIEEMSAGEQSVFPILYEFVTLKIAYSVVLIDEIDLNLHPPAAQILVSQLLTIAPTCQFIITTHSESVSNVIGESDTYRLPGGILCL
ncbi:ATPase [Gloeothece citriformis PCC 7424]|uniref:ATPase n=1 Tax=Gloeothece citriformis (strain PCC 7424) TaxID=65393 RepID=B7K9S7_GLOC7|nr:ATP-binding protein [Gloeothece citriformis]ACK70045.1 ATPase [Gloeothece citriformis PCC 7424]